MLPQRLDILIAFKSISLAPDLSVTEKRVASALIDHFNRQTTQCDPSLDTLAILLGIHRRTVIRSVNRLGALEILSAHSSRRKLPPKLLRAAMAALS